jgi:hypothetical protein
MKLITFGTYDFTGAGIGVREIRVNLGQAASGLVGVPGAEGSFDAFGTAQNPKAAGTVEVNFDIRANGVVLVDTMFDSFATLAYTGQQWLRVLLDDGTTYRRLLAKLVRAERVINRSTLSMLPIAATFEIAEPWWYGDAQVTSTIAIGASPTAVDLTNAGTAPLVKAMIQFVGTCNRPKWTNNTNGYSFELNRNISSSKTVLVNLAAQTVTLNTVSDWSLAVIPATQIGLFKFDVGVNDIDFTAAGGGTPSGQVQYVYRLMFH